MFEAQYRNDEAGAPAYDPAILLKIIVYAYSKGVSSSRQIEQLCRDNVVFMALSADSAPHFTTIADFISRQQDEIVSVFRDVLLMCDEQGQPKPMRAGCLAHKTSAVPRISRTASVQRPSGCTAMAEA